MLQHTCCESDTACEPHIFTECQSKMVGLVNHSSCHATVAHHITFRKSAAWLSASRASHFTSKLPTTTSPAFMSVHDAYFYNGFALNCHHETVPRQLSSPSTLECLAKLCYIYELRACSNAISHNAPGRNARGAATSLGPSGRPKSGLPSSIMERGRFPVV